jgi:hypothetical protein
MILALLLLLCTPPDSSSQGPAEELAGIYSTYQKVAQQPSLVGFVDLDKRLRAFMASRDALYDPLLSASGDTLNAHGAGQRYTEDLAIFREMYQDMGVSLNHWSDLLQYDGRFMDSAYQLAPNSEYRSYTLYAEVERGRVLALEEMACAFNYIREFPNGPWVADAYERIASHYADAYVVTRDSTTPWEYCIAFYEGMADTSARKLVMPSLRQQAIEFYQKAAKLAPGNKVIRFRYDFFLREEKRNALIYCSEC